MDNGPRPEQDRTVGAHGLGREEQERVRAVALRSLRYALIVSVIATSRSSAQSLPQLALDVSVGAGEHTTRTTTSVPYDGDASGIGILAGSIRAFGGPRAAPYAE